MPTVVLYNFFPFAWIQHLLRVVITYTITTTISKEKYGKLITFGTFFFPCMAYSFLSIYFTNTLNSVLYEVLVAVLYYVMVFIICFFMTESKLHIKILAVFFSFFAYVFSASVSSVITTFIFPLNGAGYLYEIPLDVYLGNMICLFSSSFIPLLLTKLFVSRYRNDISPKNLLFYVFPITHILNFVIQSSIIIHFENNNIRSNDISTVFCVANVISFVIDFAILIAAERINKVDNINKELQEQNKINELEYQRIMLANKENEGFKKIRHDYLNLLSTTAGYIEIGKYNKALDLIHNTSNDVYNPISTRLCSNDIINTIFSFKSSYAAENEIVINAVVNEQAPIKIDDYNTCRILCNLIDNSINATKEANANSIEVIININDYQIEIITKNKFLPKKKLPTSNHGYGTKIIKDILKAQGGTYSQSKNGEYFITNTIIENKNNTNN